MYHNFSLVCKWVCKKLRRKPLQKCGFIWNSWSLILPHRLRWIVSGTGGRSTEIKNQCSAKIWNVHAQIITVSLSFIFKQGKPDIAANFKASIFADFFVEQWAWKSWAWVNSFLLCLYCHDYTVIRRGFYMTHLLFY